MVERFNQRTQIRQSNLGTGAASGLMQLSRQFQNFSEQARQRRVQRVQEESFKEGQAALQQGEKPEFKKERFFGGVSAKAYNKGLMSSYLASLSNDAREALSSIERQNMDDSASYQEAVNAERQALEQEVDPEALPEVLSQFDKYASNGVIRVQDREFDKQRKSNIESTIANADSLSNEAAVMARNGDKEGSALRLQELSAQLDSAVDSEILSREDASSRFREAEREASEQVRRNFYDELADSEGFEAAFQELEKDSSKVPNGWAPDEWDSYIASQQSDLNQKMTRTLRGSAENAKQLKKQQSFDAIEARINGDDRQVLDKNAVDAYYSERVVPMISQLPAEQQGAIITNFVDRTKIIPLSLKNQASSFVRSGNPELMAEAVSLADRLDEIPGAGEIINSNERVFTELAVNLSQNLDPNEAVRLARQATDPKDSARIEAVNSQLKEVKNKRESYEEAAKDIFTSFWRSNPSFDDITSARMGKEYGDLYEAYRRSGADESQAEELAKGAIQRNWSEWEGRVMKYSPAIYYSIDGDSSYVMDQLVSDVNSENMFGESVSSDRIILVSNDSTARGASIGNPSYGVTVISSDGTLIPLDKMWVPDMDLEIEKRKSESMKRAADRRLKALSEPATDSVLERQSRGLF